MGYGVSSFKYEYLEQACKDHGIKISELAELIGISRQSMWNYKKGRRKPSWKIITEIAKTLNYPNEFFMNGSVEDKPVCEIKDEVIIKLKTY